MSETKRGKYIVNGVTVDANGAPLKGDSEPTVITEAPVAAGSDLVVPADSDDTDEKPARKPRRSS